MWSKAEFFIYRVSYFKIKNMKAKEKAKDLVKKSIPLAHDWETDNKVVAVKIALLCVDEIIKATQREYINDSGTGLDIIPMQYWLDVKHELSLL
jgi:ATP-dependent protease HslVU (ClpYQ) peptidase subunit